MWLPRLRRRKKLVRVGDRAHLTPQEGLQPGPRLEQLLTEHRGLQARQPRVGDGVRAQVEARFSAILAAMDKVQTP